jgi:2-polyprenyl-3-methyl-5-hydroxy-6-metoxy-1,4-benzoquinol methylase
MKKIVIHAPIATDATSFYRAFGPFNKLQDVEIINGSNEGFEYNWHTLQNIDIVFAQRPSTHFCLNIIRVAKNCNKPVWIDYDDDYIKIPATNPRHDLYQAVSRQAQIRECMRLADVITVSTPAIKKSILEDVETDAEIIVVPNACDWSLFQKSDAPRSKTILWRGGDTHAKDAELYQDAIKACFDKYPEYQWFFYGHKFDWMIEHSIKTKSHKRVNFYEFEDLMTYFKNLMQIRPEILIVPLEDNVFNRSKSNISWIEGTLAGATVMASSLPEFVGRDGCALFDDQEDFVTTFDTLVTNQELSLSLREKSLKNIPDLDEANSLREEIIDRLTQKKFFPKVINNVVPWDDKRFFEYCLLQGHIQENPAYTKGHHNVADWLINKLDPETMIEFGCGPGGMLERFLTCNVESIGLELNDYFIDYFQNRNPVFHDRIIKCNFAVDNLDDLNIDETDLGVSIEVFEHIDKPEEWWDSFIQKLSKNIRFFYFTSTPNRNTLEFDLQWGHCNIRQEAAWIDLFKRNGWRLIDRPKQICSWDLLFQSVNK